MKRILVLGVLLTWAMVTTAAAQQIVAVYFEEIDGVSAISYVFTIDSATMQPIGFRTIHIRQLDVPIGNVLSFVWFVQGDFLVLQFPAGHQDALHLTGYNPEIDVLFFDSRPPGYWAGCRSPYVPQGIPQDFGNFYCSRVGLALSDEDRAKLTPEQE